jgi:hypothetical protein
MVVIVTTLSVVFSACTPGKVPSPTSAPSATLAVQRATIEPVYSPTATIIPTATIVPMLSPTIPAMALKTGDFYFTVDGQQNFIFSRNLTGNTQADFDTLLDWTHKSGSKLIRVHITAGWSGVPWINKDGTVNETWAKNWDRFFDQVYADGIYIVPVFGVWVEWNNGIPDYGAAYWKFNLLNKANGGPISSPGELFLPDSAAQQLWLQWVKTLVERWQTRKNIAAWEIFSEVNIASGAPGLTDPEGGVDETAGVDFVNRATAMIHASDPSHRPFTASLAGTYKDTDQWAEFYKIDTNDFIEIHPYDDKLDRAIVSDVAQKLAKYHKPVLIGESGLWTLSIAANAARGIKHAIWADIVSGAMNGRALWSNDSYAIYTTSDRALAYSYLGNYATAELSAANFTKGVDFSGFTPLTVQSGIKIWGAAVGNEKMIIGWFRDAQCEPPDWPLQPVISKQNVTIHVPGSAANWQVDFYSTDTGTDITSSGIVTRKGDQITITLPDFTNDIAFKLYTQSSAQLTSPTPGATLAVQRVKP